MGGESAAADRAVVEGHGREGERATAQAEGKKVRSPEAITLIKDFMQISPLGCHL